MDIHTGQLIGAIMVAAALIIIVHILVAAWYTKVMRRILYRAYRAHLRKKAKRATLRPEQTVGR